MIIRNDVTSETYYPIPFSTVDLQHLKKAFQDHAPDVELDLGHTDTGLPFVTVTDPRAGFDDAPPCTPAASTAGRCIGVAMGHFMSWRPLRRSRSFSGPGF